MRGRGVAVLVAAVAASSAAPAATAYGAGPATNIAQPGSGRILEDGLNDAGSLPVSGTTQGLVGNVDILCYLGSHPTYSTDYRIEATNVTVTGNVFSTTLLGTSSGIPFGACTLRAVPTGTKPADPSPFTGPQLIVDHRHQYTVSAGPNAGAVSDYEFTNQQNQAYSDFFSVSSCGFCEARLFIDPTSFYNSASLFSGNAALYSDEQLTSSDRGYAQIDGHNALLSWAARQANPNGTPFPVLTMSSSFAPNGDMMIVEDEDAVRCPTDVLPYGSLQGQNSCATFLPTGVHLHRTIFQTLGGTVVQVVDIWSSTDNAVHTLNLDYDQHFGNSGGVGNQPPAYEPSFAFPWVSPNYAVRNTGDMAPSSAAAPVSMFVKGNSTAADGDPYYAQGAITVNPAPSGVSFYNSKGPHQDFALNFTRQIPAGGALTIQQTFSIATTQAAVAALAAQAEDQQDVPVVAISAPANGATVTTPTVTVTGTATDRNVAAVSVNGQPAAVGAGGAFSAQVGLKVGPNTLTATATDAAGNQGSASMTVAYQLPAPKLTMVGALMPSRTGVSFSVACQAEAGAVCNGLANLDTLEKLLGKKVVGLARKKRSSMRVVVGSTSFSLASGKTQAIVVPLNGTGRKLLARFKRLPATLTVKLLNTNPPTVLTSKTTIKAKKQQNKRNRHH